MAMLLFKFQCMVYEKHIIWTKKDKIMKDMASCGKQNRDYAAFLKNAVKFLVV
jgi:hypothetical protein